MLCNRFLYCLPSILLYPVSSWLPLSSPHCCLLWSHGLQSLTFFISSLLVVIFSSLLSGYSAKRLVLKLSDHVFPLSPFVSNSLQICMCLYPDVFVCVCSYCLVDMYNYGVRHILEQIQVAFYD